MDPDETLRALREMAGTRPDDRWAELFSGLDQWLTRGGFAPAVWSPGTAGGDRS